MYQYCLYTKMKKKMIKLKTRIGKKKKIQNTNYTRALAQK